MTEFKSGVAGETEALWRQAFAYLWAQDTTGMVTDGVLGGLQVLQTTTASTGVLVGFGSAVVQDSLLNGVSPLISNAVKTQDVLVANPMGATPRNDLVVFDAATSSIRVITGVPNAVPSDPTVPLTAVVLARLRHAASATTVPAAKIDDLRLFTGLAQAPVTFGGTPLLGTYNAAKPIRHFLARKTGTSDAVTGYTTVSTLPATATAILAVTFGMNLVVGHTVLVRTDLLTSTTVTCQLRNSASPYGGVLSTAYDFSHDISYQV